MKGNTSLERAYTEQAVATSSDKPTTPREQILAGAVYLTEEAAKVIRCQPSTIRHAIRCGKIHAQGRPYRILGAELFKFVGGAS